MMRNINITGSHGLKNRLFDTTRNQQILICLGLIVLSVLAVRAFFFFAYTPGDFHGRQSPDYWLDIARNVASGEGYTWPDDGGPTARRGPTVVYFFATVLWILGDRLGSIVTAQWLAEVGTAIVIFFIALELFRDRWVALTSSLLFACYAPGLIFTIRAWSEPVFSLALASFTLSFLRALRMQTPWRFLLCGVCLGLVILARPIMQFYPLVILGVLVWSCKWQWRKIMLNFAAVAIGVMVVLSPWIARNYAVFNAFIPGSSHSGIPFYQSHFALGESDYWRYRSTDEWAPSLRQALEVRFGPALDSPTMQSYIKEKGLTEYELDRVAFEESVKTIREFPGRYLVVSGLRFLRFWFSKQFMEALIGARQGVTYGLAVALINGSLLFFGVLAYWRYRGDWFRASIPLLLLVTYNAMLYSATIGLPRFSVPIMPYVIVIASHAIVSHVRLRFETWGVSWRGVGRFRVSSPSAKPVYSRTSETANSGSV